MWDNTVNRTIFEDIPILLFLAIVSALIMIFAFKVYRDRVIPFITERNYIKRELLRASSSREYRHWKRRLKRLYILNIPILGKLIIKHKS